MSQSSRMPRAEREQQMLDAAIDVFSERGFHHASMDAIARHARISKPMLYLYWGSKEELFAGCIEREAAKFIEAVSRTAAESMTPHRQLAAIVGAILSYVAENRESWQVLYRQVAAQSALGEVVDRARDQLVDAAIQLLGARQRGTLSPTSLRVRAIALVGAGEAVANRVADGEIEVEDAVDDVIELLWTGLQGRR